MPPTPDMLELEEATSRASNLSFSDSSGLQNAIEKAQRGHLLYASVIAKAKEKLMGLTTGSLKVAIQDAKQQATFFAEVIAVHPLQFWLEGCTAPCVRGTVIGFRPKPGARPVSAVVTKAPPTKKARVES